MAERVEGVSALFVGQMEAARVLGVGETTLKSLIRQRILRSCKIGRRRLIHRKDLEALAEGLRSGTLDLGHD
jgi:excisionase family DNA binding protein